MSQAIHNLLLQSPSSLNLHWSGKVFLWQEQALFVGKAAETSLHASPAIKICVALEDDFGLRTSDGAAWQSFRSALIGPGQLHAIDGRGNELALLVLAPEARVAQPLASIYLRRGVSEIAPVVVRKLFPLFADFSELDGVSSEAARVCRQMVHSLEPCSRSKIMMGIVPSFDPRVSRTVERLHEEAERAASIGEIAAQVALSESRFSHLFSDQMRVSPRRYLLWLRLREALQLLAAGATLTGAAHGAGFADSAHLTRTFRGMLGIAPTSLIKHSSLITAQE